MIDGIDDDPEPGPVPPVPQEPERPMVRVSLGFYHYLQECADLVAAMSTDPGPINRLRALEWRIAARAIQLTFSRDL